MKWNNYQNLVTYRVAVIHKYICKLPFSFTFMSIHKSFQPNWVWCRANNTIHFNSAGITLQSSLKLRITFTEGSWRKHYDIYFGNGQKISKILIKVLHDKLYRSKSQWWKFSMGSLCVKITFWTRGVYKGISDITSVCSCALFGAMF